MGIAIMVETDDALGDTEAERRFPFFGTSAPLYAQLGYTFEAFLEFRISPQPPAQPSVLSRSVVVPCPLQSFSDTHA